MLRRDKPVEIGRVIAPESVALIGATEDYQKFGGRILHHLVEHGFEGRIFPINPRRESVLGVPCYASVDQLPEAPDVALVAVPASALAETVELCGRGGVGACVVVTAQMAEFSEEGAELERRIVEIAKHYNMRIAGPNCMGMIVPAVNMALSSTPTLRYARKLRKGGVALVSQSGALMGSLFVQAHDHGVGLSGMVSIGNQADLELCDFVEAFLDRDDTNVICLYVEGLKNPDRLRALALRARRQGKCIIAVKAGRTDAGSTLTRSHTSSLAGSYSAFEALCRESGILLMDDPDSMILCAGVLSRNPGMGDGAVGVVCSSGGGGAIMADRFELAGISMADYGAGTRERLGADYQPAHQNNPLDLGAHKGALEFGIFQRAMDAIHDDPGVAVFAYVLTPQPMMPETLNHVISLWERQSKPVVLVLNTSRFGEELRQRALEAGLPFVTRSDDLLRALALVTGHRDASKFLRERLPGRPEDLAAVDATSTGFLTEPQAKAFMANYGVKIPAAAMTTTQAEAVAAAERIGYPVVLKGVVSDVVHKSELGLVKPGLESADAVRTAFGEISAAIKRVAPDGDIRIDVQRMIGPGVELIAGISREPGFGPQLVIGAGGIYVELLKDVAQKRAPVSPEEVEDMLRSLRIWPLLSGARGQTRMDIEDACRAISRLSWLAEDLGERLVDFEVNPFRVTVSGSYALDGRGTLAGPDTPS